LTFADDADVDEVLDVLDAHNMIAD
jgi:hypothetical protein